MLLTAAAITACAAADLFPVAGTVVNATANSPLPRAYVHFYRAGAAKPVASVITGDNGRFQFRLPAGSYRMFAGTRDTWENYGAHTPGTLIGSAVIVGPGKDTANIMFRYFPPGAISGRIVNDTGEPAPNALVQLIRANVEAGIRKPAIFAFTRTNDLGEFRFGRLPGDVPYYLAVTGEAWYAQTAGLVSALGGTQDPPDAHATAAYAPVYYPNTADPAKATPIVVKPGEEARADFQLRTVANGSVTVRVNGPAGTKGTVTLTYDGVAGTVATQQAQQLTLGFLPPSPDGQEPVKQIQTLQGVPPGRYKLTVSGALSGAALAATASVDVNGSDVTVDLTLKPPPKVEGTVHLVPGASPKGAILVSIRGEVSGSVATARVRSDGSFSFPAVMPGHFRFALGGPAGFFASQVEARGGTFKDGLLEVFEDSDVNLSVTASNEIGELRGFVIDGDHPIEGVLVVLASAPGQTRAFQTESDGSFDFRSTPAGRYRLFAVDNTELEYARPDVIAPYLPGAREIEVVSGSSKEERIPITSPPTVR